MPLVRDVAPAPDLGAPPQGVSLATGKRGALILELGADQAKELLAKFSQEATISGQLELRLDTSQSFLNLAESIAASWEEVLNIKTRVKVVNAIDPEFQVLLVAQEIPLDPDQHALWHSTQDTNIAHYSDLKIDKLLEDGRKISDFKKVGKICTGVICTQKAIAGRAYRL